MGYEFLPVTSDGGGPLSPLLSPTAFSVVTWVASPNQQAVLPSAPNISWWSPIQFSPDSVYLCQNHGLSPHPQTAGPHQPVQSSWSCLSF